MSTRLETIDLGAGVLQVVAPTSPREMLRDGLQVRARSEAPRGIDTRLPFWARVWPSSIALARELSSRDLAGVRAIELGAGLGVAGLAAARMGASILLTDREPEALDFARQSAALGGLSIDTAELDWNTPTAHGRFDLVLVSDVMLEEDTAGPLARTIAALLEPNGTALIADPWFPNHRSLEAALRSERLKVETQVLELTLDGTKTVTRLFEAGFD